MKKVFSLMLAVILSLNITTISFAAAERVVAVNENYVLGTSQLQLNGINANFGNLFISSADVLTIKLKPDMFLWENSIQPTDMTIATLADVSIKAEFDFGGEFFRTTRLVYDGANQTCNFELESRADITFADERLDGKIVISCNNTMLEIPISGWVGNHRIHIPKGDKEITAKRNNFFVSSDYIKELKVNFASYEGLVSNDVHAYVKVLADKHYYLFIESLNPFAADTGFWEQFGEDATQHLWGVYQAYSSDNFSPTPMVQLSQQGTYYVYNQKGSYLGLSTERLPYAKLYLLFDKKWDTGTIINGNSSSNGGGSSSRDTGVTTTYPTPQILTSSEATAATQKAVQNAKTSGNTVATINMKNISTTSLATMQAMVKAANGMPIKLAADSTNAFGNVDVCITLDPTKATKDINLSASTTSDRAKSIKSTFEKWFNNNISVISFAQQGDFGMEVEIAAKIDSTLGVNPLYFYAYDSASNTYKQFTPQYWTDENGYLHFNTTQAGDIVITDKPLEKK